MTRVAGGHGRWAVVDLGTGESSLLPVEGLGGPVAALDLLLRRLPGRPADPLDPAVPTMLVTSAVGGRAATALARCAAVGLSPLSGGVAETRAEGPFGAALTAAGVDGVVVTGRAGHPVTVVVERGRVSVADARPLWGATTDAATDVLAARYGGDAGVAVIGPAGERGVRYASVVTARHHPLPRLGFGAVWGARNLKAVVCVGDDVPPVADAQALAQLEAAYLADLPLNPLTAWQQAVPGFGAHSGAVTDPGYLPVANWSDTTTLPLAGLAPASFAGRLAWSSGACPGCPTDCIKGYAPSGSAAGAGLHQEAVAALGPNLGVDDLDTVLAANLACERHGLDPTSLGGTLACLFEAAATGTAVPASGGVRIGFGEPAAVLALTELVATGDGALAAALGGGAARLARGLGRPELAMTSKDVELPPFDPRLQPGLGLGYAVAPIGPRYDIAEHDADFDPDDGMPHARAEADRLGLGAPAPVRRLDEARADRTATLMALWSALDALLVCPFASTPTRPLTLDRVTQLVEAVSGAELPGPDLLALGRTRLRRQRAVNARQGIPLAADTLPARFFTEPVAAGRYQGAVLDAGAFAAAVRRVHEHLDLAPDLGGD